MLGPDAGPSHMILSGALPQNGFTLPRKCREKVFRISAGTGPAFSSNVVRAQLAGRLPWRGRVGERSEPGWGESRGHRACWSAVTPTRPPSAVDLPPPGGGKARLGPVQISCAIVLHAAAGHVDTAKESP